MTLLHYMTWALNANSLFVNKPVNRNRRILVQECIKTCIKCVLLANPASYEIYVQMTQDFQRHQAVIHLWFYNSSHTQKKHYGVCIAICINYE